MGFCPSFFTEPQQKENLEYYMFERLMDDNGVAPEMKESHQRYVKCQNFENFKIERKDHQRSFYFNRLNMEKIIEMRHG